LFRGRDLRANDQMINALVKNDELTTGHIAVVTLYINADTWSLVMY